MGTNLNPRFFAPENIRMGTRVIWQRVSRGVGQGKKILALVENSHLSQSNKFFSSERNAHNLNH